ncbi:XdhC family protein [Magnetospira thiophila]
MTPADDPLKVARDWLDEGHGVALATVVGTWGSAPRPLGSHLVVNDKGAFAGSVSGGCIEGFLVSEALDIMAEGQPRVLEYGITTEQAQEVRLACGGTLRVFVEPLTAPGLIADLIDVRPVARVIDLANGHWALLGESKTDGSLCLDETTRAAALRMRDAAECGPLQAEGRDLMVVVYAPPRRLIVIGAVHIAQTLAPLGAQVGFETFVIDPRPAFARPERLPGVTILTDTADKALPRLGLDAGCAVVALAHDPMLDDPALRLALESKAFYIGCLGSRRNQEKRLNRLRKAGYSETDLARLHGPVGLDIGARTPQEIAISILAEVIAVQHGKDPRR